VGWGDGYKRQMEIYQWLFREAGHTVSNTGYFLTGYFLYVNGSKEGGFYEEGADGVMRFTTTMLLCCAIKSCPFCSSPDQSLLC
jgi:hypothetical protein